MASRFYQKISLVITWRRFVLLSFISFQINRQNNTDIENALAFILQGEIDC